MWSGCSFLEPLLLEQPFEGPRGSGHQQCWEPLLGLPSDRLACM